MRKDFATQDQQNHRYKVLHEINQFYSKFLELRDTDESDDYWNDCLSEDEQLCEVWKTKLKNIDHMINEGILPPHLQTAINIYSWFWHGWDQKKQRRYTQSDLEEHIGANLRLNYESSTHLDQNSGKPYRNNKNEIERVYSFSKSSLAGNGLLSTSHPSPKSEPNKDTKCSFIDLPFSLRLAIDTFYEFHSEKTEQSSASKTDIKSFLQLELDAYTQQRNRSKGEQVESIKTIELFSRYRKRPGPSQKNPNSLFLTATERFILRDQYEELHDIRDQLIGSLPNGLDWARAIGIKVPKNKASSSKQKIAARRPLSHKEHLTRFKASRDQNSRSAILKPAPRPTKSKTSR